MQFKKTPDTSALPVLPAYHTPEELKAWKAAVAALPSRVTVPALSENPSKAEEAHQRLLSQIEVEQRMQEERHRLATDPREIQKREDIARVHLAQLDAAISRLEVQKMEILANNPGLAS